MRSLLSARSPISSDLSKSPAFRRCSMHWQRAVSACGIMSRWPPPLTHMTKQRIASRLQSTARLNCPCEGRQAEGEERG